MFDQRDRDVERRARPTSSEGAPRIAGKPHLSPHPTIAVREFGEIFGLVWLS